MFDNPSTIFNMNAVGQNGDAFNNIINITQTKSTFSISKRNPVSSFLIYGEKYTNRPLSAFSDLFIWRPR